VEMRTEEASYRDPRRNILRHYSMLHAPERIIGNQLNILNEAQSVQRSSIIPLCQKEFRLG
jgi:hypothetical protein